MSTPLRAIALTLTLTIAPALAAAPPLFAAPPSATRSDRIEVPGAVIDLVLHPGRLALSDAEVRAWVETSALAVATYLGRFPVPRARVEVFPEAGSGVWNGRARPGDPLRVTIAVGDECDDRGLARDWMMTHELVHLGFPSVPDRHHWIEEGLATYVEPLARLRLGQLTAKEVWSDLVRDLPQGLPEAGDRGLDHTPTWGRTYWGGALFCLLADVEIRSRTGNRKGLEDALAAIQAAGGVMSESWPLDRALALGDAAIGVPVLGEIYQRMRDQPCPVDLPELWRKLGVAGRGRSVVFDDGAPLAAVRRAITTGTTTPASLSPPTDSRNAADKAAAGKNKL